MSFAAALPLVENMIASGANAFGAMSGMSGMGLYIILLLVATVVSGMLFRLICATCHFVADFAVPIFKLVLIIAIWIVLILLVNKLELITADASKLFSDFHGDFARLMADVKAPLF